MKTQSVSFQGIDISHNVSPQVRQAIKKSPAIKRFGMFYSAKISSDRIGSSKNKDVTYSGLFFKNVKPRNIFVSMFDVITGRKKRRYCGLIFNSGRKDDIGMADLLGKIKKNTFVKMIADEF